MRWFQRERRRQGSVWWDFAAAMACALMVWAVAIGLAMSSAGAQTVNATFLGGAPAGGTVVRTILTGPGAPQTATTISVERFDLQYNSGSIANTFLGSGVPGRFYAFCIEPRQSISANQAISYDFVPLEQGTTNIGGMGAVKAGLIEELFGRWMPSLNASMTAVQAGALQVAIWEIVRETAGSPLDVFGGNIFFATPESVAGVLDQAQTYVQSLTGSGPRALGLNALINGPMGDPGVTAGTQDLLVQVAASGSFGVPEPGTLVVLGMGLAGLAAVRRREARRMD